MQIYKQYFISFYKVCNIFIIKAINRNAIIILAGLSFLTYKK